MSWLCKMNRGQENYAGDWKRQTQGGGKVSLSMQDVQPITNSGAL